MSSMLSNPNPQLLLNRHNYKKWCKTIKGILEREGLIAWLDKSKWPTESDLSAIEIFKLSQSRCKAAGLIKLYCNTDIELEVSHLEDPSEIWNKLKATLDIPSRTNKAACVALFLNLRKLPEEDLPSFITRFEDAYRQVIEAGENISENQRCYKLLSNLPEDLDYLAREFEKYADGDFKFDKLKLEIIKECNRRDNRERIKGEIYETIAEENPKSVELGRVRNERILKGNKDCFKCGKRGHLAVECRNKNTDPEINKDKVKNKSFVTEFRVERCYINEEIPPNRDWTLDSASTSHVCQNREFFVNLKKPPAGAVIKMGTTPHKVMGIGDVEFTVRDGLKVKTVNLKNVLYVPSIHRNLISMGKMDKAGLHAKLDKGFKIFSNKWQYMWSARLKDNFYILRGQPVSTKDGKIRENPKAETRKNGENLTKYEAAFAVDRDNIMLWHERLGHVNLNNIKEIFKKGLVEHNSQLKGEETRCEACIYGKSTRATHPKLEKVRSNDLLQLIHSDIWGPAPIATKTGYRYVLTFIDDYSRRAFCYPLRTKDEVLTKLKDFIKLVERQTGKNVKALRTDNALEFCSGGIETLLRGQGIKHEKTNPYSPQMNGVAERYNRSLFEGMRTLLYSSNLPDELWLEAMMTSNYTRNKTLHSTIRDIPFRRWYGRKPNVKYMKRFGCVAYTHIPPQKRNKFQPRARKGIFVGYGLGTAGYRIWFPDSDEVVESKHVTFDEAQLGRDKQGRLVSSEFDEDNEDNVVKRQQSMGGMEHIVEDDASQKPSHEIAQDLPSTSKETIPFLENDDIEVQEQSPNQDKQKNSMLDKSHEFDHGVVRFHRYLQKRRAGQSKGKIDVYVLTPDGKSLRSMKEMQEYCLKKKISFTGHENLFSIKNTEQGLFLLMKEDTATESESEDEEYSDPENEKNSEDEACCTEVIVPRTPREAKGLTDSSQWKKAGQRRGKGYKARLVMLGNNQRKQLNFNKTFSPGMNFTIIRIFIAIFVCMLKWKHSFLDVRFQYAYLCKNLDKPTYIKQPADYTSKGRKSKIKTMRSHHVDLKYMYVWELYLKGKIKDCKEQFSFIKTGNKTIKLL